MVLSRHFLRRRADNSARRYKRKQHDAINASLDHIPGSDLKTTDRIKIIKVGKWDARYLVVAEAEYKPKGRRPS